eukprot:1158351-Pelagomonas_calceolata.AAC.7
MATMAFRHILWAMPFHVKCFNTSPCSMGFRPAPPRDLLHICLCNERPWGQILRGPPSHACADVICEEMRRRFPVTIGHTL